MRPSSPDSPLTYEPVVRESRGMDLFHKLMELVDKNAENIPDGDYLQMCDTIKELRDRVKPPPFLLDQNEPLWVAEETGAYDEDFYNQPYEATLPTGEESTPDFVNFAHIFERWESVNARSNTDEMTREDLALVALATAHETALAEAIHTVQNDDS